MLQYFAVLCYDHELHRNSLARKDQEMCSVTGAQGRDDPK